MDDVIDSVMGFAPGSHMAELRARRDKIRHYTQTSYEAALHPADPRNLSYGLRAALALRMARLWNCPELERHYAALMAKEGGPAEAADPAHRGEGWLGAVLERVDLVTRHPKDATAEDVARLRAAGLDDRDIVTLAGLIAYVNYQILVVSGLRMLKDH